MKLAEFNSADPTAAQATLRPCIDIGRWVEAVAGARPYGGRDELLAFAAQAASPFTPAEVEAAMAHHPRIGERPTAASTEASMSRSEQAGVDPADAAVAKALARGNREYEEKFGRVFLIRAAGRSAQDILAALNQRLTNSAEEEDRIVAQQLREIAVLRLEGLISE
ncbi:2-oxo-4-hydroxy-4-carboxy-5-ureidoimidazoline decarboxylase [Pseudarthrobacter sp. NIBRBAC000502770]|uniref:2-oxo-4-hydroxy-4-carboxy-5-ureidoimidazoline decarboxylase n=1 Tax=Pseudarthrobacter sp. NIBRBAC000502770 TaxID=2590785 RepID=UPI0011400F36|nr:2-oxo-4-hydroxy-4-carboxy-5-ureidoimidazoline decarboxylase [Pseudarthrobacter sp. NIBRBAC000502770]QDG89791.1 2-oxo-4-hydroxy-4-carboxy-5-ureidoimidazoline decarboxylase [Pseudarthrobacter sp. NIBRBAC000502770]